MSRIKPYKGNEPHIFISYAHKDSKLVMPIIERLVADGYRVWYDIGIPPGQEWDEYIAEHIVECACVISMITPNYILSKNCRDELKYARSNDKEQFLIYLSPTELTEGLKLRLDSIQAVFKYAFEDEEEFYAKLYEATMLEQCKGDSPETVVLPKPRTESEVRATKKHSDKSSAPQSYKFIKDIFLLAGIVACMLCVIGLVVTVVDVFKESGEPNENTQTDTYAQMWASYTLEYESNGDGTCTVIGSSSNTYSAISIPEKSPDGDLVTAIGEKAFYDYVNLEKIWIPSNVRRIEKDAFSPKNKLTEVHIDDIGAWLRITFADMTANPLYFARDLYLDGKLVKKLVIPDGVTQISSYSLAGSITELSIPKSVTHIGYNAFSGAIYLTKVSYDGSLSDWQHIEMGDGVHFDIALRAGCVIECTDSSIEIT